MPPCVMDLAKQILPDFIHLFTGLKKARALREEDAEEDEDEAEIDDEEEELSELEDDQFRVLIKNKILLVDIHYLIICYLLFHRGQLFDQWQMRSVI